MDIKTDGITEDNASDQSQITLSPEHTKKQPTFLFSSLIDPITIILLALIALIPRFLMAMRLDVVTDEVVYILGGKIYIPLITHLDIANKGWRFNYEHPPFVKLLIGSALSLNTSLGHPLNELLAARVPSILFGTILIVAIYWLGRMPFGRVVALLAALTLAVSPWLVYFSALAYLDMTMTALITVAYLLLWHAIRRPWLYILVALLVGLAAASKYTAVLAIPGMLLFTLYYFLAVRFYIPREQRPKVPWLWWLAAIILAPLIFLASDPAIWPDPLNLLHHSFDFELHHSVQGHLTFIAGQYSLHVPHWAILYIIFTKISAFVTIPATLFVLFAIIQLVRFHFRRPNIGPTEAASISFLLIWLLSILGMFSLLNIVVGTHYHLPLAPPVAMAGAFGLAVIFRYRRGSLFAFTTKKIAVTAEQTPQIQPEDVPTSKRHIRPRAAIMIALLAIVLIGPHLLGLTTVYGAEGYTSEFFHGENTALQVAYPGYREAVQWLAGHTRGPSNVGLVALVSTLQNGNSSVSWYHYNSDLPSRFKLIEAHPDDYAFPYSYLVWPMHLVQRGYKIPEKWRSHIVHIIMGGDTVYCYIMARFPATVSQ